MGATENGHGGALSVRLDRFIAKHEAMAAAGRLVRDGMTEDARESKGARVPAIVAAAVKARRVARPRRVSGMSETRKGQLARAGKILAAFDRVRPRTVAEVMAALGIPEGRRGGIGVGPLKYAGYLKAKGDGFVRTKKVHPSEAAAGAAV